MQSSTRPVPPFDDHAQFAEAVDRTRAATEAYHAGGIALMADGDYDQLVARITVTKQLHPAWDDRGVTTEVAAGAAGGAVRHHTPMLSLDKAITALGVTQFVQSLNTSAAVVEVKVDGMAIHVDYREGHLHQAATRGDGITGDDITHQVTRDPGIAGLPRVLPVPWTGSLRGEIYMTTSDFDAANAARVGTGGTPFANPRNAVAGSIRKIDRQYIAPMSFATYAISGAGLGEMDSHLERMAHARSLGFTTAAMLTTAALPTGRSITCRRTDQVQAIIDAIDQSRQRLPYPIDGAVIKADSRAVRNRLGASSSAPRWAIAYKYAPDTAHSVLRDIEVSVGRTGRAGFTAVIDPVSVAGTTIRRASLHNVAWISQHGFGIGARVAVMRANDVIPQLTAVVGERPDGVVPWEPPTTCPQCDQPWDTNGQLWRCTTPACSLVSHLTYSASRDVWDIDGLGEEIATALVDADLVRDIADLFTLTVDQIAAVPYSHSARTAEPVAIRRIGSATADKLAAGIDAARKQPLARHITALGIRMTGRRMGRALAAHFGSLDALRIATVDDLAAVDRIGPEKARSIHAGLRELTEVIDRLITAGITTAEAPAASAADSAAMPLAGQRVVITGAIEGMNRTEAQDAAEQLGATVSGSVSTKTDLLIVGSGSSARSKLTKATELGIPTMPGVDFVALYAQARST